MLEVLHNVPLTSLYSPAHEKNAGDCEKRPDSVRLWAQSATGPGVRLTSCPLLWPPATVDS